VSLLLVTIWRPTNIYFVPSASSAFLRGWPYTLLTVLLGWWGLPWGPICTVRALGANLASGRDVTEEVHTFLTEILQQRPGELPQL
jgi:hypothetical protein